MGGWLATQSPEQAQAWVLSANYYLAGLTLLFVVYIWVYHSCKYGLI